MSGLFDNEQNTQTSSSNLSGSWNQSNMMKDPRYANAMATFFNTFNPAAVANSGQVNPLQTAAGANQAGVMPFLGGVGAQAGNIAMNGITPGNIENFRNQYAEMAINPTIQAFDVMRDNAMSDIGGNAATQGALGNRGNVQQAKNMWDAQNMPGVRKDIANMMATGYQTAANTAGQSVNAQVAGLGAANQAAGAMSGANQTMSNMGEQQRLAGLTPFQIADLANTGLLKSSTVYGQEGLAASTGTGTSNTQQPANLGSILGGLFSFFARDGGAIKWPGYEEGKAGGGPVEERPGYFLGGGMDLNWPTFGGEDDMSGGGLLKNILSGKPPPMSGLALVMGKGSGSGRQAGPGGKFLDNALGFGPKDLGTTTGSTPGYSGIGESDPGWGATTKQEYAGLKPSDVMGSVGKGLSAASAPKPIAGDAGAGLARQMASQQMADSERLRKQMEGRDIGGPVYSTDVKGYPSFPKFDTMKGGSFESFPVPEPSLEAPITADPQGQGNQKQKQLAQLVGVGAMASGMENGGVADGGVARIGQKVQMAYRLFKELGGSVNAEPQAGMQAVPGFQAGGDPGGEAEWRAGTTAQPARQPLEVNVQNEGREADAIKIQALEAELEKRRAAPAPAAPAAAAAAPAKEPWSFRKGLLHPDSPLRQVVPMNFLDDPAAARRASFFQNLGSPSHNPFHHANKGLMDAYAQDIQRQKTDQEAAALLGKIKGPDGQLVPTVDARRVAVEESLADARRGALQAQHEPSQIRIKGIEQADANLAAKLQQIDRAQLYDTAGHTPEGMRHYDGQRDQARATHRATIMRLQGQDGSGTNPVAPTSPTAPRAPMPKVESWAPGTGVQ